AHGTRLSGIFKGVSCGLDYSCSPSSEATPLARIQSVFVTSTAGKSLIRGASRSIYVMPRKRDATADSTGGRRAKEKRKGRVRDISREIIERETRASGGRRLHFWC